MSLMHSPTLRQKFQVDPWPCEDCDSVLFILDVINSFEEELLKQWIDTHVEGRENIARHEVVEQRFARALGQSCIGIGLGTLLPDCG